MEPSTVTDGGDVVSNAEQLARTIWKKALGYTETRIKAGYPVDKVHDAAAWAIQLLMDRMEGKAATIQPEAEKGISAVERIGELAVETVNRLTEEAVGPPGPPPLLGPDGGTDASE